MTCRPELVTGYLDGALSAEEHRSVETHLPSCPACRAQLAAEQRIRARLRRLSPEQLPPGLEQRVRSVIEPRHRSWLEIALPLAACLVLALLVGRGEPWVVAHEIAGDHRKCFDWKNVPAKVWSGDMNIVARWFSRQGVSLPPLPERVGELQLVGARFCPLADLSITPHLYYVSATRRASIFALQHDVRISPHYRTRAFGNVVGLVRVGPKVLGVVAGDEDTVGSLEGAILGAVAVARAE